MAESGPNFESPEQLLISRIKKILLTIAENPELSEIDEMVRLFDKEMKQSATKIHGSTAILQKIKPWQALSGGSPEVGGDYTPEQKAPFVERIEDFVIKIEALLKSN